MRNLKRALSLTLASVMLLGMMVMGSSALSFNDADDISNVTAATVLEELGVMQGDGQGNFMPDQSVTRAQMAILICRILYGDKLNVSQFEGTTQYTDVAADAYYTGYINLATQLGIIGGYGDGRFGPDDTVTTAQAALMLSRALGYFKANELADGDWALASVAQATKINMFGNLKLGTNELLSRDNVCEMVFNTMTKAVPVQYSERWDLYYTDSNNVLGAIKFSYDETLAYRNFDLVYDADETDDFYRPVTEWGIGTIRNNNYGGGLDDKGNIVEGSALVKTSFIKEVNEADATYTKEIKVADIYKDLGLSETVRSGNVYVYDDGDRVSSTDIKKNDTTTKYGGNGTLTQVFFFPGSRTSEDDRIVITQINTYTGETVRNVAASGSRDAYVLIATSDTTPADVSGDVEFETDETLDEGTRVIYTYSQKEDRVVELAIPETASGTVTKTENANSAGDQGDHKALTIDGTRYEKSKKGDGVDFGSISVKNDYTVYLDFYGYMIYVEETDLGNNNYALLIDAADAGTFIGNKARLLFTDGTVKNVDTDKNYSNEAKYKEYSIVTFRVDNDGEYTLKFVDEEKSFINKQTDDAMSGSATGGVSQGDGTLDVTASAGDYAAEFEIINNNAKIVVDDEATDRQGTTVDHNDKFRANSATAFVVADPGKDGMDSDFTAYTGIKNAPSMVATVDDGDDGIEAFWYCKNGNIVTVMFIFPGENIDVDDGNSNYIYIARESAGNTMSDVDDEVYIEYNTIIGGVVQTSKVKVSGEVTIDGDSNFVATGEYPGMNLTDEIKVATNLDGLFKSYSSNKRGIVTNLRTYNDYTDGESAEIIIGAGLEMKRASSGNAKYTLILDTKADPLDPTKEPETITASDNCKYFYVDEDGKIFERSYKSISTDPDDVFYAVVKDYEVQTLIVEQVGSPAATYDVTIPGDGVKFDVVGSLSGIERDGSVTFTLTPKKGITIENVSASSGVLTSSGNSYTISGITRDVTVTVTTSGEVSGYAGEISVVVDTETNDGLKDDASNAWTASSVEYTGAEPTDDQIIDAIVDKMESDGYTYKDLKASEDTSNADFAIFFTKGRLTYIVHYGMKSGSMGCKPTLSEVAVAASQTELNTALSGTADKIKLTADASLAAAPGKDIEVASNKKLTLTGNLTLTNNVTGAGKVITTGDITAAQYIKTAGGVEVADTKTLTASAAWTIAGDVTGAGKVSVAGYAITNGDEIKCTGGLEITAAGGSVDKLSGVPLSVAANVTNLTAGRVAPSTLTMTGTIGFDSATAELVIPASAALMGITIGDNNGGKITLAADATVPSSTAIALGDKGVLDLGSNTLSGGASNSKITTGTGAKIVGASGNTQNFFTDAGDGTRVANDEAAVQSKTFTYDDSAGGTNVAGWAHS